jgi:hypothetical protein
MNAKPLNIAALTEADDAADDSPLDLCGAINGFARTSSMGFNPLSRAWIEIESPPGRDPAVRCPFSHGASGLGCARAPASQPQGETLGAVPERC